MMKRTVFAVSILSLAGCSTMLDPNSASSNFSCAVEDLYESEGRVVCKTPMAVYNSTHEGIPRSQSDVPVNVESYPKALEKALGNGGGVQQPNMPSAAAGLSYYEPGNLYGQSSPQYAAPVRTPATVMRIWFAPWIDKKDDLHLGQYVFTEIEPRKWSVGAVEFMGRGVAVPTKQLEAVPGGRVRQYNDATQGSKEVSGNQARVPLPEAALPAI